MTLQRSTFIGEGVGHFPLRFPEKKLDLDQDEEWCEVKCDDTWKRIRLHDYHEIYRIPGLYEALFVDRLKCCSPERVIGLLDDVLSDFPPSMEDLSVLDVGAGNGMVGEELHKAGVRTIQGIDIIPRARVAALRDRPQIYDDYFVCDLTQPDNPYDDRIRLAKLNTLTVVAALGYGDIPPAAFVRACNLIDTPGWLAFNIKENFLDVDEDNTGFCALIRRLRRHGCIQVEAYRRYQHRLSINGKPLHYIAMVARKIKPIPVSMLR
ncbi:MAG TPA: methyltransferase [Phycisphaerae bacterium]|nr:methyltransferase [Phycisphaerae bacterium]